MVSINRATGEHTPDDLTTATHAFQSACGKYAAVLQRMEALSPAQGRLLRMALMLAGNTPRPVNLTLLRVPRKQQTLYSHWLRDSERMKAGTR